MHLVGVGGSGMSAIAEILAGTGHQVSGSTQQRPPRSNACGRRNQDLRVGHSADQIGDAEIVAISTAIPDTNPEVVAAKARVCPS
ncbi:MAG: Mur ligase domain-containing protein [Acidimicrobiales bacterium]